MSGLAQWFMLGPFFYQGRLVTSPRLYHYVPGTTQEKTAWSDRNQTITAPNPIVGDANGLVAGYFSGLYKIEARTSSGILLGQWDNVKFNPQTELDIFGERTFFLSDFNTVQEVVNAAGTSLQTSIIVTELTTVSNDVSLSSAPNIHWFFLGTGRFVPVNGATLTLYSPDTIRADPTQFILDATSGTIIFSAPGTVSPCWFGAVGNGSTNDGTALSKMVSACPAKSCYAFPPKTFKSNSEMAVTVADITVRMTGATLDISTIAGTGTAGVHETVDVLCGFKVTGDRFTLWDGRITGAATSDGKNLVGVLSHNADFTRIYNTKTDTLYCGLWAGGGATDYTLSDVEVFACSRNILLGFQPLTVSSPQVTRATLRNVNSHGATAGDGVKLYSFSRQVEIIGGHYYNNSNNGIDMYVCGEYVLVDGVNCEDNAVDGIDMKYAFDSGEGANQLGLARRTTIRSSIFRNNGQYGIRSHIEAAYTGSDLGIQNATIEGNLCEGNGVHGGIFGSAQGSIIGNIFARNTQRGAMFTSCQHSVIQGNVFVDNGTAGANASGCVWGTGLYAGAGNSKSCVFSGNVACDTRSGGSRTQNRGFEFATMDDCVITGNTGKNHSTADFLCAVSATGGTRSRDNTGTLESGSTMFGVYGIPVVARASLPAAGATQDGLVLVDDNGAGDRNLMIYVGGERFRIDGGAAV